jgi:hypothetical protein
MIPFVEALETAPDINQLAALLKDPRAAAIGPSGKKTGPPGRP